MCNAPSTDAGRTQIPSSRHTPINSSTTSDQITKKYGVRQNQIGQNRLVEADRAVLDETLQVLLKTAMSELGAENLVLAEKQKKNRSSNTNYRDGLGKGARDFAHQVLLASE